MTGFMWFVLGLFLIGCLFILGLVWLTKDYEDKP